MRYIRAFIMGIFIGALMVASLIPSMDRRSRKQFVRISRRFNNMASKKCQCIKRIIF